MFPGRTDPSASLPSCPSPPQPAPPCRRAPPRPDPPVVCPFDSTKSTNNSINNFIISNLTNNLIIYNLVELTNIKHEHPTGADLFLSRTTRPPPLLRKLQKTGVLDAAANTHFFIFLYIFIYFHGTQNPDIPRAGH